MRDWSPSGSVPSSPYPVSKRTSRSLSATSIRSPLSSPFLPRPQRWNTRTLYSVGLSGAVVGTMSTANSAPVFSLT